MENMPEATGKVFIKPGEFFVIDALGIKHDRIPSSMQNALRTVGIEIRDWNEGIIPSDPLPQHRGKSTY